jgi:DNA-binding CsgD family transcriptional regulator/Tfp pilus assembly protein PilF
MVAADSTHAAAVVGREEELQSLARFVGDVEQRPAALIIEGEAGVGKTTLWRSAIRMAVESGQRVLVAGGAAVETQLGFAGVADLLEPVVDDVLSALPVPQRNALEATLLLAEPVSPQSARVVSAALLTSLRELAQATPVVIAVDDVHWLDPASAGALGFAVRRLRDEPIALLLAVRTGDGSALPFDQTRVAFAQRVGRVTLGPLTLGALRRLLLSRTDLRLTRPLLRRIHEASGGNPFFALELGRALARQNAPPEPGEPLPVPGDLRPLLTESIAQLPPDTREALLVTALLARPSLEAISQATGQAGEDVLRPAFEANIVELVNGAVRFAHPLLRSTVHAEAPTATRVRWHRRLAAVVRDIEERAQHLALATVAPDEETACVLDEAARCAFDRGAVEVAASLGERAVFLTPGEQSEALQRRRLLAAGYLARAGAKRRARELVDEAREAAPSGPDRARMVLTLAWWGLGERSELVDALGHALEDARGDGRLLAELHAVLGGHLCPQTDISRAAEHASRAVALAEQAGDPTTLAVALVNAATADFYAGKGMDVSLIERAIALEEARPHPYGEIGVARYVLAAQLAATGELDAARRSFEALAAEAQARADAGYADFLLGLARVEARAGEWERAQRLADEAVEIDREVGDVLGEAFCHETLVELAALRGDIARARALAAEGLRLAERENRSDVTATIRAALGRMELSLGDPPAARPHLEETALLVEAMGIGEPGIAWFVPDWVEALVAAGDLERAEAAAARLEEQGRRLRRGLALAGAARCRGLVAASRGELDAADAAFERALAEHERLPFPFERARTLLAYGIACRRAKRKRAAREALEAAHAAFAELGAERWAERAMAELSRIGGRTRERWELTPTERRVAELVAQGLTNKEVAGALVISVRAVEANLTRIYAKLGVRSRTGLARLLTRSERRQPQA